MRARLFVPVAVLAALSAARTASADLLAEGEKGVKQSILVQGELPAGKAVILAHTFHGLDVVKLGEVQPVSWHPAGGDMALVVIDDSDLPRIEAMQKGGSESDRQGLEKIAASGAQCPEVISGFRTTSEKEPWDEIRRTYKIAFEGGKCIVKLGRAEYFDKAGNAVKPLVDPMASAAAPSASATATGTSGPAAKSGCSCSVIGSVDSTSPARAPLAASLLAASLILAARRRRGGSPAAR
ncbi:MAG: hypothetical protein U0441_21820 [Polyangiaceae bacterium]